jgi:L-fucose isomerase-like protein
MAARVTAGLRAVVRRHRLGACSVRCFDLVTDLSTTGCLALSALLDEGVVAGCEGDLPATLTMLWMQALSGQPSFMANPQDLDPADRTLWLAHCTVARSLLEGYTLRSHFESGLGVGIQGDLPPGEATLARIGGEDLREVFLSDGQILASGSSERRCRTQVKVRLREDLEPLLERPLGNHHVLLRGHWAEDLRAYHDLFIR